MVFHDFPMFLGNLGVDLDHSPQDMCRPIPKQSSVTCSYCAAASAAAALARLAASSAVSFSSKRTSLEVSRLTPKQGEVASSDLDVTTQNGYWIRPCLDMQNGYWIRFSESSPCAQIGQPSSKISFGQPNPTPREGNGKQNLNDPKQEGAPPSRCSYA